MERRNIETTYMKLYDGSAGSFEIQFNKVDIKDGAVFQVFK